MLNQFINKNSAYEVEHSEMKYLLAYMHTHEFNLFNSKYLSKLFLPTNCSAELLKDMNRRK